MGPCPKHILELFVSFSLFNRLVWTNVDRFVSINSAQHPCSLQSLGHVGMATQAELYRTNRISFASSNSATVYHNRFLVDLSLNCFHCSSEILIWILLQPVDNDIAAPLLFLCYLLNDSLKFFLHRSWRTTSRDGSKIRLHFWPYCRFHGWWTISSRFPPSFWPNLTVHLVSQSICSEARLYSYDMMSFLLLETHSRF